MEMNFQWQKVTVVNCLVLIEIGMSEAELYCDRHHIIIDVCLLCVSVFSRKTLNI